MRLLLFLLARRRFVTVADDGQGFIWRVRGNGTILPDDPDDPRLGGGGVPFVRDDLALS